MMDLLKRMLAWRGLAYREPCKECGGSGVVTYGSTATWRGGIGGSAMTEDVCDKCWGSGDADKPWPSHREFYAMKRKEESDGNRS